MYTLFDRAFSTAVGAANCTCSECFSFLRLNGHSTQPIHSSLTLNLERNTLASANKWHASTKKISGHQNTSITTLLLFSIFSLSLSLSLSHSSSQITQPITSKLNLRILFMHRFVRFVRFEFCLHFVHALFRVFRALCVSCVSCV